MIDPRILAAGEEEPARSPAVLRGARGRVLKSALDLGIGSKGGLAISSQAAVNLTARRRRWPSFCFESVREDDRFRPWFAPVLVKEIYDDRSANRPRSEQFRAGASRVEPAALMFYDRLFELDPSLRGLFHTSREDQARKLGQALSVVVKGIDRPAQLRGAVEALGRRHAGYGVRDEHYATVGEALIRTLEEGLGEVFTPETRAAWIAAYSWLAFVMCEAAAHTSSSDCPGPPPLERQPSSPAAA